jgi:hypothetical protein
MNEVEQKRHRIATAVKWGLGGLAALIVSPIIFMVVKGIIGLAVAAVAGLAIVNFAPVVAMKFANWKVKAIKAEAQQNPIETMENLMVAKRQALETFRIEVTTAVRARSDFEVKCRDFGKRYPDRAQEFKVQLGSMTELVERKKRALQDADDAIQQGEDKLVEMRAYWEMSQAAQAANKAARMSTGDMYEKLKADTAVDAVLSSVNQAFAELEVAATLDQVALPAPTEAIIIDMPVRERVA